MAAVAEHPGRRRRRGSSLLLIFLGIGIGFYAGRQISVIQITASPNAAQPFAPVSETVLGTPPRLVQVDNTGSVFTLHRHLAVKEDQSLFDSELRPKLDSLLNEFDAGTSSLNECKNTDLEPYLAFCAIYIPIRVTMSKTTKRNMTGNAHWSFCFTTRAEPRHCLIGGCSTTVESSRNNASRPLRRSGIGTVPTSTK